MAWLSDALEIARAFGVPVLIALLVLLVGFLLLVRGAVSRFRVRSLGYADAFVGLVKAMPPFAVTASPRVDDNPQEEERLARAPFTLGVETPTLDGVAGRTARRLRLVPAQVFQCIERLAQVAGVYSNPIARYTAFPAEMQNRSSIERKWLECAEGTALAMRAAWKGEAVTFAPQEKPEKRMDA